MSPRLYNRITTASLVGGVISALLFEHLGHLNWIAGLFGILAGVTAVITYIVNQSCVSSRACATEDGWAEVAAPDKIVRDLKTAQPLGVKSFAMYADAFVACDAIFFQGKGAYETAVSPGIVSSIYASYSDIDVMDFGFRAEPSDPFVGYVVGIVEKLSTIENDLEFEVTREGNLLIRQAKRASWRYVAPDPGVQDEPTLQFPNQVH